MDKFHEQLLKTQKNALYKVLTVYMYVSIFLVTITAMLAVSSVHLGILLITVIFGATYLGARITRDRQYKEFEYIFTNGNLQIDVIFNMRKRKTLYDVDIKDLEEFGKSDEIKIGNGVKQVVCFPWNHKGEKYTLILNKDGRQAVFIAPDDEIVKMIKIYNVRRPR